MSTADPVPVKYFNPWRQQFFQIFLTHTAQPGKKLYLAIGRLASADPQAGQLTVTELTPLERAVEHNTAELANTDILAAALTPTNTPCLFRVMCVFDTAGTFRATITKAANTQTVIFNGGTDLALNCLYIFDHLVHSGDSINYQYSVNAQLMVLRVQEIVAGVQ